MELSKSNIILENQQSFKKGRKRVISTGSPSFAIQEHLQNSEIKL